jgi:hypothetical protein
MDEQTTQNLEVNQNRGLGWVCLVLWAVLIVVGIVEKRMFGQGDLMVFFHLPAAVFLVLAFYILSAPVRARYNLDRRRFERRSANSP